MSVAGHHYTESAQISQSPSSGIPILGAGDTNYGQQGKINNLEHNLYHHQQQAMASSAVAQQQIQNLVRPNAGNSFSPYYSPPQSQTPNQAVSASAFLGHPQNNAHLMSSSPRISSPPPPGISSLADSVLLGSPIQQQQHLHEYRYEYVVNPIRCGSKYN